MEIIHTDVRVLRVKVFSRWVLVSNPWLPNGLCLYQIPVILKVDNINKSFAGIGKRTRNQRGPVKGNGLRQFYKDEFQLLHKRSCITY